MAFNLSLPDRKIPNSPLRLAQKTQHKSHPLFGACSNLLFTKQKAQE